MGPVTPDQCDPVNPISPSSSFDHRAIERKWQSIWQQTQLYEADLTTTTQPFYNLMMFPYPSAEGLHVGNVYAFTGADIYGRFLAMQGRTVFEPIGFDAFGIHSENFAIKRGVHPSTLTARNVERFRETQLKRIGNRFCWNHEVQTTDPSYYKWTQWIFLQLFKAGLAVRKKAAVNWCPSCKTVLADEQVIGGECERCGAIATQRELEQWFFKITQYAQRLLDNLDHLDWSERVKTAQRNWIGRSEINGKVEYHLRDWLISRQRYWGPPIPIVYCATCGTVPVPEDRLPVQLPPTQDWLPKGTGNSPLADIPEFVNTTCPCCGGVATRETDVSDNFLDSAWYFLRYPSSDRADVPFDPSITTRWLPVDMYIGGAEHSVLHLLYSRFITMVLHDLGHIPFEEPFRRFRAHGLLTQQGAKMSKSKGNVVNPDRYIEDYGADTLRTYLMFLGPYDQGGDFSDHGIAGIRRFLNRVYQWVGKHQNNLQSISPDLESQRQLHQTIHKVTQDIQSLKYNTAIAALMSYFNTMQSKVSMTTEVELKSYLLLLTPFAPHLTEELWQQLGESNSVHQQAFPKANPEFLTQEQITITVQINGRVRTTITLHPDASEAEAIATAKQAEAIQRHLTHQVVRRTVYVPGKVLNFVIPN
ncbi:class I tRNA ligase family protein (plasmid) [Kovacikia minuta CCNUW1]|uniref:leucine--tRNA ligase n=1 Tax=Kovacikia minuta TaxID=2931930 RepID=UPI001CCAB9E2|nr:leucine--tRNA ligase [Kovacikia minuta]UBF30693.1 class I tRNA ligase family protein [Kovacikia minuta CCNUW1]